MKAIVEGRENIIDLVAYLSKMLSFKLHGSTIVYTSMYTTIG